jgi:hypothetical protein
MFACSGTRMGWSIAGTSKTTRANALGEMRLQHGKQRFSDWFRPGLGDQTLRVARLTIN